MDSELDCVVVAHYDSGFESYEQMLRARGVTSGAYRNLRMDFITLEGQRLPYLEVLNRLTGQQWHWTELPQLAPFYLSSFLQERGIRAAPGSFYHSQRAVLEERVRRARVVAITSTLYLSPIPAIEVVSRLRQLNPQAFLVLGGPLVDNLHFHLGEPEFKATLADIGADAYVLERQGEQTLLNLIRALKTGSALAEVKNCYIPTGNDFSYTGAALENNVLEEVSPNWNLFSDRELGPTVQTRTARSCAFSCAFCDYPTRAGPLNLMDMTAVEHELKILAGRGIKNLVFVDDTFNVPAERFKEFCRMMIRNKFQFKWYSYFRCSNARDEETFDLMKESGCHAVFLGIESGDQTILKNMHKAATLEQYRYGMAQLHRRGITTFASFIVGFPGETAQTVQNMSDFINETAPTFFRGEIWFYNPRSPIHQEKEKYAMQGMGHRWQHATMNWSQASDLVLKLFDEVKNSTWLPMYDFDFWIIPYLEGKGLSITQIRQFLTACNNLLAQELGTASSHNLPARIHLEAQLNAIGHALRDTEK